MVIISDVYSSGTFAASCFIMAKLRRSVERYLGFLCAAVIGVLAFGMLPSSDSSYDAERNGNGAETTGGLQLLHSVTRGRCPDANDVVNRRFCPA